MGDTSDENQRKKALNPVFKERTGYDRATYSAKKHIELRKLSFSKILKGSFPKTKERKS